MSCPNGKCPNMDRSDLFLLIGKQQKIAHLIAAGSKLGLAGWL